MQECGTPSEGVENLPAAETSKYVLWLGYGRKHADYSFGRSHGNAEITDSFGRSGKSAGCGNVEIRLVAGVWQKTCGLLLRKESRKHGDYRLLRKE